MNLKKLWVMIALLLLLPVVSHGEDTSIGNSIEAQKIIESIVLKLSNGKIKEIEILQVPSHILTRTALTPDMIRSGYHSKLSLRNRMWERDDKFMKAIRSVKVQQSGWSNLRWGVIFYDSEGEVGAIFFDIVGEDGYVNEIPVRIKGKFFKWVEGNFSKCFEN